MSITAFYNEFCIVHANHNPIVISFIGAADVNVGLIHAILPKVKASLDSIRSRLLGDI